VVHFSTALPVHSSTALDNARLFESSQYRQLIRETLRLIAFDKSRGG
jgi:hypothetical protein